MPLLFSYGTLQDEQTQRSLYGRTLVGQTDYLVGYEQNFIRVSDAELGPTTGRARHAIVRPAKSSVTRIRGTVFEVTDEELELTDRYEPVEYKRVMVGLASGIQAWVYVAAETDHAER